MPKYNDFKYPKELLDWLKNEKDEKILFLTGKSRVAKTSGVISLLNEYNHVLIRDINGLKDLKQENKALILDHLSWADIPREVQIHLLDKNVSSHIRILYSVVDLPAAIIKVVTSNNAHDLLSTFDVDKAIERKIAYINIDEPIYSLQQNSIVINLNL